MQIPKRACLDVPKHETNEVYCDDELKKRCQYTRAQLTFALTTPSSWKPKYTFQFPV